MLTKGVEYDYARNLKRSENMGRKDGERVP